MSADANGGRWRLTDRYPEGAIEHYDHRGSWIEIPYASHASREFSWEQAVEYGWIEPVPWPLPEVIGSFG